MKLVAIILFVDAIIQKKESQKLDFNIHSYEKRQQFDNVISYIETLCINTLPLRRSHCDKHKDANRPLEHPLIIF